MEKGLLHEKKHTEVYPVRHCHLCSANLLVRVHNGPINTRIIGRVLTTVGK